MRRVVALVGRCSAVFLGLGTAPALAASGPGPMGAPLGLRAEVQPVRLDYAAPATCPDVSSFYLRVRARTQLVRLADPGELASDVQVHITDYGAGRVAGVLELPPAGGEPFSRRVEGSTCDEVVLALSLVLALAYDPDALTTFTGAPPPPPPSPPPYTSAPPPEAPRGPAPPEHRTAAGLDVTAMSGLAPALRPVIAPFIEYGAAGDALFRPAVAAALLISPATDIAVGATRRAATLRFSAVRVSACPIAASVAPGLELTPCLTFEVGQILGQGGAGLTSTRSGAVPWTALGLTGALRWMPAGGLFVQVVGGAGALLRRGEFLIHGPDETVHTLPPASGQVGLGAGVHFP